MKEINHLKLIDDLVYGHVADYIEFLSTAEFPLSSFKDQPTDKKSVLVARITLKNMAKLIRG